ncbi:MAG: T9SS type A sorting domain-containing protein [Ekhidna sp.]
MTRYITIVLCFVIGYHVSAQTTHEVTVAINQGVDCPITGLDESDVFSVYPNPIESSFTIKSAIKEAEIKLIDLNGKKVRSRKMTNGELQVEVSDLPKGIYIIHFEHVSGSDRIKIKIQ